MKITPVMSCLVLASALLVTAECYRITDPGDLEKPQENDEPGPPMIKIPVRHGKREFNDDLEDTTLLHYPFRVARKRELFNAGGPPPIYLPVRPGKRGYYRDNIQETRQYLDPRPGKRSRNH
ncbi:uncharacterized protein LOC116620200 [Nematostella vectensis]|uniref:uncharacterized protein LOC116620200 n=1 Tax=Nematostella vectensis TaxID=45351 RepID=UPI0013901335|nr:uncharacterized protein LOC116620200 [Nematostella vectensis]